MSVIFLGGFFLPAQTKEIDRRSRLFVQYAADAFQRSLVSGLSIAFSGKFYSVNLPYIGSYPQAYSSPIFRGLGRTSYDGVSVYEPSFLNPRFLRIPARALGALYGILKFPRPASLVVYSPYLPFMFAAYVWSLLHPTVKVVLIVPDLIEFMGAGGGIWRKWVVQVELAVFRLLSKKVDKYVLLTEAMATRLGISADRYIVVEGMIDSRDLPVPCDQSQLREKSIVYSGTLDQRYGIIDLLESFRTLPDDALRLVICGAGDAENMVRAAAEVDPRIKFLGRIPQAEAQRVQRNAHVLVNPRRPEGEFTQYSFPSKTIEYMSTGRPVVMHHLPGMPADYLPFVYTPATPDQAGLAECLRRTLAMPDDELARFGHEARSFVLKNKTAEQQCARIAKFIDAA